MALRRMYRRATITTVQAPVIFYYRLIAYVGSGETDPTPIWVNNTGLTPLDKIHRDRPDVARFAIVEHDGKFRVLDMWEVEMNMETLTVYVPDHAVLEFPTRNAAIMTAQLKL